MSSFEYDNNEVEEKVFNKKKDTTKIRLEPSIINKICCSKKIKKITIFSISNTLHVKIQCNTCRKFRTTPLEKFHKYVLKLDPIGKYCTLKTEHSALLSDKYCIKCCRSICEICFEEHTHYIPQHFMSIKSMTDNSRCLIHKGHKIEYLCQSCNVVACEICWIDFHSLHLLFVIHPLFNELNLLSIKGNLMLFEDIIANNKKYKEDMILLINSEKDLPIKQREKLYKAYMNNERNNVILYEIMRISQMIHEISQNTTSLKIMKFINNNKPVKNGKILKNNCRNLIEYYKQNYIVNIQQGIQCVATIESHTEEIGCMIQLNDGRLATGSWDTSIKLWNVHQFNCEATMIEHTSHIFSLVQLKDSRLVSGARDKTIKIWDLSRYTCIKTLTLHDNSIMGLIQLKDSQLVSCSGDKKIKLWDITTFTCLHTLQGHSNTIYCILQLKDGRLASGSWDKTVKVWDIQRWTYTKTLKGHTNNVVSIIQLTDGRLISGSADCTIILWNINTMHQIGIIIGSINVVFCLLELKNDLILSGSHLNLSMWDCNTLKKITIGALHNNSITALVKMKDGRIASGSYDKTIKIWQL